jgi:hypothetical protein
MLNTALQACQGGPRNLLGGYTGFFQDPDGHLWEVGSILPEALFAG